jgi:putative ABC transport system permease protein
MNAMLGIIEGLNEIRSHKFRSLLTVSGVVLGVASLMAMFAVVEGMTAGMRLNLNRFGGVERVSIDSVEIPPEQESIKDLSRGRTYDDVRAIRLQAPLIEVVSPEKRVNRVIQVVYGNRRTQIFGLRGVEDEFLQVDTWNELEKGRFITDVDLEHLNRVVVLGAAQAKDLFPDGDSLGKKVRFETVDFTVIGVLKKNPHQFLNSRCFIPLSTMMELYYGVQMVGGVNQGPAVMLDEINVKVRDFGTFGPALEQLRMVLDATHRGVQDFGLRTREDWFEAIEAQVMGARLSGGLVAVVCLLAGAVGITNIMLASIKERTREIGVRRAIGAQPWDIFSQIAMEVFLLALLGGVLGVVAGWGLVGFLEKVAEHENAPVIRLDHTLISLASGIAIGMGGGLLPALRAAQLEPIEALRYE